jgi:hypothetical protein
LYLMLLLMMRLIASVSLRNDTTKFLTIDIAASCGFLRLLAASCGFLLLLAASCCFCGKQKGCYGLLDTFILK